jgi:hypothetical protein
MTVAQEFDWLRRRLLKVREQATFNRNRGIP